MKNFCEECIFNLIRRNKLEATDCSECGNKTMQWKQNSNGTFFMECSFCGNKIAADLNTPCELDCELRNNVSVEIKPQKQLPTNTVILELAKFFQLSPLVMRKKLNDGYFAEIKRSEVYKVISLLKKYNIVYSTDYEMDITEKYPLYKQCKYPYSPLSEDFNDD